MTWQQISVVVDELDAEWLSALFSTLGAVSVTFQDAGDQPIYEPELGSTEVWHQTRVIALFEMTSDPALIKAFILRQPSTSGLTAWQVEQIEDRQWTRCWMDHFQPMPFGKRLWVCPTSQPLPETDAVCLKLDPGLAFGTGTHPTTALCLEWLSDHRLEEMAVIDYGCGSGILAVAALLLGAEHVDAVDIDPQALIATRDNSLNNGVEARLNCTLPEQMSDRVADLLLANILAGPLIELSAEISARVCSGGTLILSGILEDQLQAVEQAYAANFVFQPPTIRNEWVRLEATRKSA